MNGLLWFFVVSIVLNILSALIHLAEGKEQVRTLGWIAWNVVENIVVLIVLLWVWK